MLAFRGLLVALFLAIAVYTLPVIANHGLNILPIFFGDIAKMAWPGQFNLDFLTFLVMSATWLAWRNNFTPAAFGLALLGLFGGMFFLSAYLLYLHVQTGGDMKQLFFGKARAERLAHA